MRIRNGPLLPGILERDRLHEHVSKHHPHGGADLGERERVPDRSKQTLFLYLAPHARVPPAGSFAIVIRVSLNDGTPVTGSVTHSARSLSGGSLKCSGKKQVPAAKSGSGSVFISTRPRPEVTLTA